VKNSQQQEFIGNERCEVPYLIPWLSVNPYSKWCYWIW